MVAIVRALDYHQKKQTVVRVQRKFKQAHVLQRITLLKTPFYGSLLHCFRTAIAFNNPSTARVTHEKNATIGETLASTVRPRAGAPGTETSRLSRAPPLPMPCGRNFGLLSYTCLIAYTQGHRITPDPSSSLTHAYSDGHWSFPSIPVHPFHPSNSVQRQRPTRYGLL